MSTLLRSGPCAPIHLLLPLLGAATGFLALLAVMATSSAHLF